MAKHSTPYLGPYASFTEDELDLIYRLTAREKKAPAKDLALGRAIRLKIQRTKVSDPSFKTPCK